MRAESERMTFALLLCHIRRCQPPTMRQWGGIYLSWYDFFFLSVYCNGIKLDISEAFLFVLFSKCAERNFVFLSFWQNGHFRAVLWVAIDAFYYWLTVNTSLREKSSELSTELAGNSFRPHQYSDDSLRLVSTCVNKRNGKDLADASLCMRESFIQWNYGCFRNGIVITKNKAINCHGIENL